jgi:hypothetical protein
MNTIYSAYKDGSHVWLIDEKGDRYKAISSFEDSVLIGYTQNSVSIRDSNGSIRVFDSRGDEISQINTVNNDDYIESHGEGSNQQLSWQGYLSLAIFIAVSIFYYNVVTWISHSLKVETGAACVIALIGTIIVAIFLFIGYNKIKK